MAAEKTAAPPARDTAADKTDEAARPQRQPRGEHRPHREKGEHAKTDAVRAESPKPEPAAPVAEAPLAAPPPEPSNGAPAPAATTTAIAPIQPVKEIPAVQVGQSPGHHPHAQRQLHPGEQRRKQQQQGKQAGPTLDLV